MSHKSPSSLEELEARCEALSRRVVDRPAVRSPPRGAARVETSIVANATQHSGDGPGFNQVDCPHLTPQDVATAVASLEREKYRLEEQLRLVNMHLAAYRVVQQSQQQPQRRHEGSYESNSAQRSPPPSTSHAASPQPPMTTYAHNSPPSAIQPVRASLDIGRPATSPSRPSSATSQTEHIYEELRQIRKMREDREAARHAQLQAQSGVIAGSYRPSTGQRF